MKLPQSLNEELVRYCVSRLNIEQRRYRELPSAVELDGKIHSLTRENGIKFEQYCEVSSNEKRVKNAQLCKTKTCIALRPEGNDNGSWKFLNLDSRKIIVRSNWMQ